jgi:hypothetical protein
MEPRGGNPYLAAEYRPEHGEGEKKSGAGPRFKYVPKSRVSLSSAAFSMFMDHAKEKPTLPKSWF